MIKRLLVLCFAIGGCASCSRPFLTRHSRVADGFGTALEDSVTSTLVHLRSRAVALLTIRRYHIMGGTTSVTVLWQVAAGTSYAKTFQPSAPARLRSSPTFDTLFAFCRQQPLGLWPENEPLPAGCPEDGGATGIGVYLPGRTHFYSL
jgi:hypothetical protein